MRKGTWSAFGAAFAMAAIIGAAGASGNEDRGASSVSVAQASAPGDLGEQAEALAHGNAFVLGIGEQPAGTQNLFYVRARSLAASGGKPARATGIITFEATGGGRALLWDATVTCMQVRPSHDAIVTGVVNIPAVRAGEHVVMEAVDHSAGDQVRFSFQHNGGLVPGASPQCWKPVFPPVNIQSGFVEVIGGSRHRK